MSSISRNSSSVALASLTATYTDSEGEEQEEFTLEKDEQPEIEPQLPSSAIQSRRESLEKSEDSLKASSSPPSPKSGQNTPASNSSDSRRQLPTRLVSYNDDQYNTDDEHMESDEEDENSRVEFPITKVTPLQEDLSSESPVVTLLGEECLPPDPPGKCSQDLQIKIAQLYKRMAETGKDTNETIQRKKAFRNPSIYEKLIEFCDIDELGSNYPKDMFDPHGWKETSYYDQLAKAQKEEMDRRERERKERTKVEFVSGTAGKKIAAAPNSDPGVTEEGKKRKSKWDQGSTTSNVLPVGVPLLSQPSLALTAAASGTKTTVISAFGSLPKKSKI